jgi:hypothetical protein
MSSTDETGEAIGTDDPIREDATGFYQREDGGACVEVQGGELRVFVHQDQAAGDES